MAINKKSVFFTISALLVLGLVFLFLALSQEMRLKTDMPLVQSRILNIDSFIVKFENSYLPRIASQEAYFLMLDSDYSEESLKVNLQEKLQDIVAILSKEMNIKTNLDDSINNISYFQDNFTGEWIVSINISLDYHVLSEMSNWSRKKDIKTFFSIEGLKDPETLINITRYDFIEDSDGKSFLERIGKEKQDCCGIIRIIV